MATPPPLDDFKALLSWLEEDTLRAAALVLYLSEAQEFDESLGVREEIPPGLKVLVDLYASVRRAHVAAHGAGGLVAEEALLRGMVEEWKRAWRDRRDGGRSR